MYCTGSVIILSSKHAEFFLTRRLFYYSLGVVWGSSWIPVLKIRKMCILCIASAFSKLKIMYCARTCPLADSLKTIDKFNFFEPHSHTPPAMYGHRNNIIQLIK